MSTVFVELEPISKEWRRWHGRARIRASGKCELGLPFTVRSAYLWVVCVSVSRDCDYALVIKLVFGSSLEDRDFKVQ